MSYDQEPSRKNGDSQPFRINVSSELYDVGDALIKARALSAFDARARQLPIHREIRFAARRKLEEIFDDLALGTKLLAQRLDEGTLVLDGPGVFVSASGHRKTDYCSGTLNVWAESVARLASTRLELETLIGPQTVRQQMFTIDWHFASRSQGLTSVAIDELADSDLPDEAYPALAPVGPFIDQYLAAPATVLVLQGPPGTGKTRLVRAILSALSRRKGDSAKVLYTADRRTVENDEIFIEFITGNHDAFVLEDADHILAPRSDGNDHIHRFLTVADGVVRALGRKIIFTTNLPNIGDIDEALIRPGRCFGVLRTRNLERDEALRLLARVSATAAHAEAAAAALPADARAFSVATVFRALETARSR